MGDEFANRTTDAGQEKYFRNGLREYNRREAGAGRQRARTDAYFKLQGPAMLADDRCTATVELASYHCGIRTQHSAEFLIEKRREVFGCSRDTPRVAATREGGRPFGQDSIRHHSRIKPFQRAGTRPPAVTRRA